MSNPGKNLLKRITTITILTILIIGASVGLVIFQKINKALAVTPSTGKVVSQYNSSPIPVNISEDEFNTKLKTIKNSLFFIHNYTSFNKVDLQVDKFLLPNANYAEINYTWKKVVNIDGKDIMRPPTPKEKEEETKYHQSDKIFQ